MTAAAIDMRKTVLITGAGIGGIGGALAKEFHAKGLRVFATVHRISSAKELSDLGIETLTLDVTSSADIQRVRDDISARTGGRLDILINNAGFGQNMPALDLEIDTIVRQSFDVNVFGVMRMVQEFAHLLIKTEGSIVFIGSVSGVIPFPYLSAYNATKGALNFYVNTLRVELKPFNVKVLNVISGGIKSNILGYSRDNATLPPNSLYKPVEPAYVEMAYRLQRSATPTDEYARSVVAYVLTPEWRRWSAITWLGTGAWMIWLLDFLGWRTVFDNSMVKMGGLDVLGRMWREEKKKERKE